MRKLIIFAVFLISCSWADEDVKRLPILLGVLSSGINVNIGGQCREDVLKALKGILQRDVWSLKMLDSSGDIESNFIWQNVYWLGSREFCGGINAPLPVYLEEKTKEAENLIKDLPPFPLDYRLLYGDIRSQHQIYYEKIITTVLHLGLCVPRSCSDEDILLMSQKYFDEYRVSPFFDMTVNFTHVKNLKFNWNVFSDWIFILTGGILICIIAVHIIGGKTNTNPANRLQYHLRHFSFSSNYQSLMSTTEDPKIVYSLNFFRTICSCWVTVAHVYLFSYVMVESVPLNGVRSKLIYIKLFYRSALVLDVFFLMSGFVLTYNFLKNTELHERIRSNSLTENLRLLLKHILHRYTRFMPTLLATLILSRISFLIFDPIYYRDMRHNLSMESSWWIWNVFFLQNFVPFSRMALVWTWSLASDMQCFIIFQVLLFIYVKYPRGAKYLFAVAVSFSIALSYKNLIDIVKSENFDSSYTSFICHVDKFYMKGHFRVFTYGCGICIGFICYQKIGKEVKISRTIERIFWSLIIGVCGIILFLSEEFVPAFALPFLFTFGRIGYTLLLGILILFAQWGYCNWINRIGKMPFFVRMSKLSFGLYMFHPILIHIFLGSHNDVTFASFILVVCVSLTVTIFTYYFSIVFNVAVEAPCNRLFDDLIQIRQKKVKINE